MKRLILATFLAVVGWGGTSLVAHPALAASLCVGSGPGCYPTIQPAVNAAHNGDVIHIGPGTFTGGITITKSVTIIGAGASATIIKGGGPVVTMGTLFAPVGTEPTVSLSGLTITGGVTTSSTICGPDLTKCGLNYPEATALGGGIEILPAAGKAPGATVTITNSVITGNRATPSITVPSVVASCPGGPCRFAQAAGGGIDSWGTLTVENTTVSANQAGGPLNANANGGGIVDEGGNRLTLTNSVVSSNTAICIPPYGRESVGGGVWVDDGGTLVITNGVVSDNTASLTSTYPDSVESSMGVFAGGIRGPASGSVTIDNTSITGNIVRANDPSSGPAAYDTGMVVSGASLVLRNSQVSNNHLYALVDSTIPNGQDGGALEFDGPATVSNTRITGNTASVTASIFAGGLGAIAALDTSAQPAVISNSVISGNTVSASSPGGTATVQGGGIVNNGLLDLRNDQISGNTGTATGPEPDGFAQGGGIWNGLLFNPPPLQLTMENTSITRNTLTASPGPSVQGGGLYTSIGYPVTLTNSVIAANSPDQCFGC
jgi:hypothetical protein